MHESHDAIPVICRVHHRNSELCLDCAATTCCDPRAAGDECTGGA